MKKRFLFLVTMLVMTLLVTVGCTKEEEKREKMTSSIQEKMVLALSEEDFRNDTEKNDEEMNEEIPENNQGINDVLPVVKNQDYCKAYAEALVEGFKMPSEEAYLLMQEQEKNIEQEPRLVRDESGEIHIVWTNANMNLVVDNKETNLNVSDCIYVEGLPSLPEDMGTLEKNHKEVDVRFGIAEEAYLENLHKDLEEKGLYKDGLKYVRFYNYNGSVVAVYSLTEYGELYIDKTPARLILDN